MPDERANALKVRYLHGRRVRIRGGYEREGESVLPGPSIACGVVSYWATA